ncbi:STAS domain-containing protein [Gordonia iterans]|uniref:STAS domain-containing protein n=1 Tax=Gordonia iterans TaxID=1004901 RepID=UPI001F1F8FDC|nr:sodium-independent anion transporter [Gordonia iterans]
MAGIVVAFVLALINLAKRAANPAIDVLEASGDPGESLLTDAPRGSVTGPGVVVIRLAAPLFFANGDVFSRAVKSAITSAEPGSVRHLVVDMEAVTDVDVTGAESFEALQNWLADQSVTLGFSRVRPETLDRLAQLGLLGDQTVYPTNRAALAALSPPEPTPDPH